MTAISSSFKKNISEIFVPNRLSLHVRGLPQNITVETLATKEWYGRFDDLTFIDLRPGTGTSIGSALILFRTYESATKAIELTNKVSYLDARHEWSKYCRYFLRNMDCPHHNCINIHSWVNNDWYCNYCHEWKEQHKFDVHRGKNDHVNCGNKLWAIAYDRWICLKDGMYTIIVPHLKSGGDGHNYIYINGNQVQGYHEANNNYSPTTILTQLFKRGDYVQMYDRFHGRTWSTFFIRKG